MPNDGTKESSDFSSFHQFLPGEHMRSAQNITPVHRSDRWRQLLLAFLCLFFFLFFFVTPVRAEDVVIAQDNPNWSGSFSGLDWDVDVDPVFNVQIKHKWGYLIRP